MRILKMIKSLDASPYSIQLNYKNKLDFKSNTGGCITLLFYLVSLVIIGFNLFYFFTQIQLIYSQEEIKNDLGIVQIDRRAIGLIITGTGLDDREFNITRQNQQQYGLKVYVDHGHTSDRTINTTIEAIACQQITYNNFTWSSEFFCFPLNFNMNVSGRSDVIMNKNNEYNKLTMIVKNVSNSTAGITQLSKLQVKLVYVNNVVSPKSQVPIVDHKVRIFFINDGIALDYRQLHQLSLFFKKLYVKTDKDRFFLSQPVIEENTFYDEESTTSVITNNGINDNWLVQIKLKRSLFTIKYDRYYKKIATYLAETLGVIGLISLVFILYKGYNKWCFTQTQLIPKSHQQSTNIFKYYWSSIRKIKNKIADHSQIEQQFEHKMDIYRILQRLDDFENRLRKLEGKSSIKYDEDHQPQYAKVKGELKSNSNKKINQSQKTDSVKQRLIFDEDSENIVQQDIQNKFK